VASEGAQRAEKRTEIGLSLARHKQGVHSRSLASQGN